MPLQMLLPGWLKPPPGSGRAAVDAPERQDLAREPRRPIFLREVMEWDLRWQRMLFQILVPVELLVQYRIDPIGLTDPQGRPVAFSRPGADQGSFRLELYPAGDAPEPMAELELADTQYNQIEVVWLALQNPSAPRFDTDIAPNGGPTGSGGALRNLAAEEAAMLAGLAPGQVRRGLGALRWLAARIETVMLCLNQRELVVQPLYYHTAVLFEQLGFSYIHGMARMENISQGFGTRGELRAKLDGSTPFRRPEFAATIRGRSWAIHDNILTEPWDRVRMVKNLGVHAGVSTCPGVPW
jgi:hypothetical protein